MQHEREVDLYAVLGVTSNATLVELQTAYKSLARTHHPDKARSVCDPQTFLSIQKAWEILRDPIARSCYDGLIFFLSLPPSCVLLSNQTLTSPRPASLIDLNHATMAGEVDLSEMEQMELVDPSPPLSGGPETTYFWRFGCRCGGEFRISETALEAGLDLVPCSHCSFFIRVLFEPVSDDCQD